MATASVHKKYKKRSQLKAIWFRFRKNKLAMVGLFILMVLVVIALSADLLVDYENDVIKQNARARLLGPGMHPDHPLGTDAYGRDMLGRIIFGARVSLFVGFVTVGIALMAGTVIGAIAGFYGGRIDNVLMRIMDIFLAIPGILLSISIVSVLGPGLFNLLMALSISQTPRFARLVRSAILSIRNQEFIEAARACGSRDKRIIFRHIIPNAIGPMIVQATITIASTILTISSLSFIGLGIQPPAPEWGSMLADGRTQMRYHPYLVVEPGIAIMLAVLSFNLIGDGLRDALDPSLKN